MTPHSPDECGDGEWTPAIHSSIQSPRALLPEWYLTEASSGHSINLRKSRCGARDHLASFDDKVRAAPYGFASEILSPSWHAARAGGLLSPIRSSKQLGEKPLRP
jgi:hypothetical protein